MFHPPADSLTNPALQRVCRACVVRAILWRFVLTAVTQTSVVTRQIQFAVHRMFSLRRVRFRQPRTPVRAHFPWNLVLQLQLELQRRTPVPPNLATVMVGTATRSQSPTKTVT